MIFDRASNSESSQLNCYWKMYESLVYRNNENNNVKHVEMGSHMPLECVLWKMCAEVHRNMVITDRDETMNISLVEHILADFGSGSGSDFAFDNKQNEKDGWCDKIRSISTHMHTHTHTRKNARSPQVAKRKKYRTSELEWRWTKTMVAPYISFNYCV